MPSLILRQDRLLRFAGPSLEGVSQFHARVPATATLHQEFEVKAQGLFDLLSSTPFHQCIVFTNRRGQAQSLTRRLNTGGWPAAFISGDLPQASRNSVMSSFRSFGIRFVHLAAFALLLFSTFGYGDPVFGVQGACFY
jgi:superfamily II DNA/RNA helicase